MPLYDILCQSGHKSEQFIPLEKFKEAIICSCGAPANRLISAPMFSVEDVGYTCPITDKWIGSKAEHKENLAQHGCRVFETGEKEAAIARRKAEDDAFDKAVETTVEKAVEAMPSDKREKLYSELTRQGLDAQVTRA